MQVEDRFVIISNKGGLPETSKSAIILEKLTTQNIYNNIEKLILNKKKLKKAQKLNYKILNLIIGIYQN